MDYSKFIGVLRNVPFDATMEQSIWAKIYRDVQKKNVRIFSFADLWPKFLVPAAALAVLALIFYFNYAQQIETRNFVQRICSTEYIYETCKYDGIWN